MSMKTVVTKFSASLRIVLIKLAPSFPKTHSQFLFSFNCHYSCVVKLLFPSGHHKALLNFPMPRKLRAERAPRKTCIFLTRSFHLTSLLYLSPNAEQRLGFALLLALSLFFFVFCCGLPDEKIQCCLRGKLPTEQPFADQRASVSREVKCTPQVKRPGKVHLHLSEQTSLYH